ncbi:MAG: ATP:cob(I)alamin adenosyltransferase, partial [Chitinophagaceae bacterium]|nr:ATP:cob(I)alamin adenosyltransferase [Chitinophagaceae bacterium]
VYLENEIDFMTNELPPLKFFVLPGGHSTVSTLHIARCVCRRAERIAVGMTLSDEPVEPIIIQYLNRLSDYLFALSRFIVFQKKGNEILWQPRGK